MGLLKENAAGGGVAESSFFAKFRALNPILVLGTCMEFGATFSLVVTGFVSDLLPKLLLLSPKPPPPKERGFVAAAAAAAGGTTPGLDCDFCTGTGTFGAFAFDFCVGGFANSVTTGIFIFTTSTAVALSNGFAQLLLALISLSLRSRITSEFMPFGGRAGLTKVTVRAAK